MNGLVQQRRFRMGKTAVVTLVTEVIKIECTLCVVTSFYLSIARGKFAGHFKCFCLQACCLEPKRIVPIVCDHV